QGGQVLLEQLPQLQPVEEVVDEGGGAHLQGFQGQLLPRLGHGPSGFERGRPVCCGSVAGNGQGHGGAEKFGGGAGWLPSLPQGPVSGENGLPRIPKLPILVAEAIWSHHEKFWAGWAASGGQPAQNFLAVKRGCGQAVAA